METKQTVLYATEASGGQWLIADENGNGRTIALVYTGKGDAEFLVNTCNSHADLLEALKNITDWVNEVGNCTCDDAFHDFIANTIEDTIVDAEAAIARATGQEGD